MRNRRSKNEIITPDERTAASDLPVWVVWWELPDKSWEALCLSLHEAETELHIHQEEHLVKTWGSAGRGERQTLLEWFENHIRTTHPNDIGIFLDPFREVLRRAMKHEPGPVVVRTW